jgi:hypothetical protein
VSFNLIIACWNKGSSYQYSQNGQRQIFVQANLKVKPVAPTPTLPHVFRVFESCQEDNPSRKTTNGDSMHNMRCYRIFGSWRVLYRRFRAAGSDDGDLKRGRT